MSEIVLLLRLLLEVLPTDVTRIEFGQAVALFDRSSAALDFDLRHRS